MKRTWQPKVGKRMSTKKRQKVLKARRKKGRRRLAV